MSTIAFELHPESGEVSNVGAANIGDVHLRDRWLVDHDDGAVAVYRIHHGAMRLVAKAAIRDGTMFTRAGRNGEPRNDQWNLLARALGQVLGRTITITGEVSDTQVSDAGMAPLQPFVTFDLDVMSGATSMVSMSREHELRARRDETTWQVVCVGDRVTVYGLHERTVQVIGRAVRRGTEVIETTSLVSPLSQDYQWKLVARGIAQSRTVADNLVHGLRSSRRRRGIARRLAPIVGSTRGKVCFAIFGLIVGALVFLLVRQGIALRAFPLWGVHVVLVPLASLILPLLLAYGGYVLTSKEALAERPRKDRYGSSSGDPLTSTGIFLVMLGGFGSLYPCGMLTMAQELAPQVPFSIPTFATPASARAAPPPDAPPIPTFAETLARTRPALGDGADNAGAWELARFASRHLRWSDVALADVETTIPLVLKDSDLERGKRLCATGALTDIERKELDRRPVFIGALRTTDGDDVRFIAVGSSGSLVKRSPATLCGVVTGRADKAVMLVGMFDLPENAQPAVER